MNKAEKLMKKINEELRKTLSIHWECHIKKDTQIQLVIKYESYEDWKEEDLVYILKLINATCTKHNLSMYFERYKYFLEIDVYIN